MTKDELFKRIVESELFKDIDQSEEFNQFIHERENEVGIEICETSEYRRLQAERERMEKEFETLYADPAIGKKKVLLYADIIDDQGAISDMTHFETGFTEGIKFIVGMLAM